MDRQGLRRFPPGLFTLPSSDYGTLSVVGVIGAGVAWYIATRYLATPRAIFFRVAVVVTLVLWAPDIWILIKHEPTRAVLFLVLMHLTVALITYNLLVFAAPVGSREAPSAVTLEPRSRRVVALQQDAEPTRVPRVVWVVLMIAVAIDFFAGLIGMLYVPFNRPNGWLCIEMRRFTFFTRCSGACWASRRSPSSFTCRVEHRFIVWTGSPR